jgi:ATP-binding cassette subfamily B multidrug efflux pump
MFTLTDVPIVFSCQHMLATNVTPTSERFTASSAHLLGYFQNIVGIQKAAKLYQNQDFLRDRTETQLLKTQRDHRSSLMWGNTFGAVFNTVGSLLLVITNIVLLFAVSTGKISAGEFFSLTYFANGVIKPLEQLGLFSGRVAFYSGAIQDIERLLQYKVPKDNSSSISSTEEKLTSNDDDDGEEMPSLTLESGLSLEQVGFRYGPDLPLVLKDVSTFFPAGTYTCIFGHSGCGKSTLLGLLECFHQCTEGRICMDGVDISSVSLSKLRRRLGVVFQTTYVLDGSIFDNIAFGYASSNSNNNKHYYIIQKRKSSGLPRTPIFTIS